MAAPNVPIYTPQAPPSAADIAIQGAGQWAYLEFQKLARLFAGQPWVQLGVLSAPPAVPRAGMIAYADGAHWNPGSGEGLYVYKSTGWKFLG